MKKTLNLSLIYAIAAMAGGVFYREFTKFQDFTGTTALGKVHTHLFMLGMFAFLLVTLFCAHFDLQNNKKYRSFLWFYNIGVPLTSIMLLIRGILQVIAAPLSRGADAAISGIAGIGHILTGTGIILLLLALRQEASGQSK